MKGHTDDNQVNRRVRILILLAVAVTLGVSFALTDSMTLDKGIAPLIPDTSPELVRTAQLLDLAPFSRVLAVQLTARDDETARGLPDLADSLRSRLDPDLMAAPSLAEQMPNLPKVMAMLPALCDDARAARIAERLREDGLQQRLAGLKDGMAGADSFVSGVFWRVDPLGLRGEIFGLFPSLTGFPQPDPLTGYPVSDDGRRLLLIIRPAVSMQDAEGCIRLMENLDTALAETLPAGVTAQIAGGHRHTAANAGVITGDLVLTMSLAMLLILAIYIFLVRSWGAVWLFLTPAAAVLVATGAMAALYPKVSAIALGFGAAVLGIAEDYAVHVHYALRRSPDRASAVRLVAKPLAMSVLLCAGGFGVLCWSAAPALRQLAIFTILSIIAGYLWAMLVLPLCPGMDKPREEPDPGPHRLLRPAGKTTAAVALGLGAASVILFAAIPPNASLRTLGFTSRELQRDQENIERSWNLNRDVQLLLVEGAGPEDALSLAGRLEATVRKDQPQAETASLARLWPPREAQEANLANWRALAAAHGDGFARAFREAAAAEGFAGDAFDPFWQWFSAAPQPIDQGAFREAGLEFLAENFLAEKNGRTYAMLMIKGGGAERTAFANFGDRVTTLSARDLERGLGAAMAEDRRLVPAAAAVCVVMLLWAFADGWLAMAAFVPALAGLAGVLAWLVLAGRSLGLVEAAGLPLVICLGADYGILAVNEFSARVDLGAARAILVSGLTTVAGIGILVLSRHPVLKTLGGTVFIGLTAAMAAAIFLLPRLFRQAQRTRGAKKCD